MAGARHAGDIPLRREEQEIRGNRPFSVLASPPMLTTKREEKKHRVQRLYHATNRNEIILPFLPEIVLFVVFAGGWTVYRTAQGKTITPDEALKAQEAYREREEELRQRQWKYEEERNKQGLRD